jgi:hypothetical protein
MSELTSRPAPGGGKLWSALKRQHLRQIRRQPVKESETPPVWQHCGTNARLAQRNAPLSEAPRTRAIEVEVSLSLARRVHHGSASRCCCCLLVAAALCCRLDGHQLRPPGPKA